MDQKTKEKIKKTLKDKFERGDLVANMSGAHSKESREKQRKFKIGKTLSDKHKNSISQGINSSPAYQEAIKNPERIKKIKNTKREKYGDENYVNPLQIVKTNLEKYDKENFISTSQGLEARKNTWIKKYGVDNPQKRS